MRRVNKLEFHVPPLPLLAFGSHDGFKISIYGFYWVVGQERNYSSLYHRRKKNTLVILCLRLKEIKQN
jgi:hypothetical protein